MNPINISNCTSFFKSFLQHKLNVQSYFGHYKKIMFTTHSLTCNLAVLHAFLWLSYTLINKGNSNLPLLHPLIFLLLEAWIYIPAKLQNSGFITFREINRKPLHIISEPTVIVNHMNAVNRVRLDTEGDHAFQCVMRINLLITNLLILYQMILIKYNHFGIICLRFYPLLCLNFDTEHHFHFRSPFRICEKWS